MARKLSHNPVRLWLFGCCGMIFVMALIGAVTRLTQSGLSITSWDPVIGALPPMSDAAWNKAFAAYQAIPQYQILNRGMSLDAFKGIYFWEWFHRLWGRMIGLVFALPFAWFYVTRTIDNKFALRLVAIFALGGLQGFIGWFMVQSGLEVRTSVSPYRLALHLGFALLLYALLLWTALTDKNAGIPSPLAWARREGVEREGLANTNPLLTSHPLIPSASGRKIVLQGWLTFAVLCIAIIWGALVAGLHAGEAYNTWPLMDGELLPDAAFTLQPAWINAFENLALVQFMHRWLGPTTFVMIMAWVMRCWRHADETRQRWLYALGAMAFLQVGLGIGTLLSHVVIALAVLHQAGAITLLTLMLVNLRNFSGTTKSRRSSA